MAIPEQPERKYPAKPKYMQIIQKGELELEEIHVGPLSLQIAAPKVVHFKRILKSRLGRVLSGPDSVLLSQVRLIPPFCPAAPPDYNSVVTEEEAEQRNTAASPQPAEDLSGILERPLMAFVQEFRFRPPPVYSEVSPRELGMARVPLCIQI